MAPHLRKENQKQPIVYKQEDQQIRQHCIRVGTLI